MYPVLFADHFSTHSGFGEEKEQTSSQYLFPSRTERFEALLAATQI